MITRILINNSPAFKLLELQLFKGFNVFSGSSGSGKSVFMESLLTIFGIKDSNADLIEANITIDWMQVPQDVKELLEDGDDEIVLSILRKEKVRYFLNHQSSSKKRLNELVSGFGKHISAKGDEDLKPANILRILDAFIATKNPNHAKNLEICKQKFTKLQEIQKSLSEIIAQESQIQTLKEIAEFEIKKIESIAPKEGEYEELLELKKTLSRQEKIAQEIQNVRTALENLHCIDTFLGLVDEQCPAFFDGLNELEALLESKEQQLHSLEDINPESLLNRISDISELLRKYGSVEEALAHLATQKQKLTQYENMAFDKQELQKSQELLESDLHTLAQTLHTQRLESKEAFANELGALMQELRLKDLHIEIDTKTLDSSGISVCNLTLGTSTINTLSAGEYNRARLGLMCLDVSISPRAGLLVLDEIDANLSGEESEGVAKILKKLSHSYQIFAISHQPHMPTLADNHYLVYKNGAYSDVKLLDTQGRIEEIARMISGSQVTKEALEFAKGVLAKNGIKV